MKMRKNKNMNQFPPSLEEIKVGVINSEKLLLLSTILCSGHLPHSEMVGNISPAFFFVAQQLLPPHC